MKRTILLLAALFIGSTTMLFSQQLEIKTLGYTEQFPDGGLKSWDYIQHSNNVIVDVLDDYLVCKRPINPFKIQPNVFLLSKDLTSAKYPEIPKEYADFAPYYLCKIGDYYILRLIKSAKTYTTAIYDKHLNFVKVVPMGEYATYAPIYLGKVGDKHFVKFAFTYKKFALATFDEQMNLVKIEPMGDFGRLCCDSNYIYLQNIPLKAKNKDQRNGELLKMDKDMNIVLRKPITDQSSRLYGLQMMDTLGYSILYNGGTFMTIDKETLEQNKLDLRRVQEYGNLDTIFFETERVIRISSSVNIITVSTCDYKGNALQNRELMAGNKHLEFLDYRDSKVYAMRHKEKDISIVAFDIETGAIDTVSTFQMEQNPGYTNIIDARVSVNFWKYDNNTSNLVVTTEIQKKITEDYYYHGYLSYFHLDKNFQVMKMEEEKYPNVGSINRCSYRIMHHCDDYTLMMQYNPKKEGTEVQYVIWDKAGNRTVVPTDQRASFSLLRDSRGTPVYTPSIYKVSHDHYYILANMPKKFILVELKVKP